MNLCIHILSVLCSERLHIFCCYQYSQRQMVTFYSFIQLFDETKSWSILYQGLRIFLEYVYEEYIWNTYLILSGIRSVEPWRERK